MRAVAMLFLRYPYTECTCCTLQHSVSSPNRRPKHLNLAGDSQNCHNLAQVQLWQKRICLTQVGLIKPVTKLQC